MFPRPPRSPLFPYTTLFRSGNLARLGQATRKGLLFYGPPGTGKTLTIHYLAAALEGHTTLLVSAEQVGLLGEYIDRKSTRLNSSHRTNSYAVFCLKKKAPVMEGVRGRVNVHDPYILPEGMPEPKHDVDADRCIRVAFRYSVLPSRPELAYVPALNA